MNVCTYPARYSLLIPLLLATAFFSQEAAFAQTGSGPTCKFYFVGNATRQGSVGFTFTRNNLTSATCSTGIAVGSLCGNISDAICARINNCGASLSCTKPTGSNCSCSVSCTLADTFANRIKTWSVYVNNVGVMICAGTQPSPLVPGPEHLAIIKELPPVFEFRGSPTVPATISVELPNTNPPVVVDIPIDPGTTTQSLGPAVAAVLKDHGFEVGLVTTKPSPRDGQDSSFVQVLAFPQGAPLSGFCLRYTENIPGTSDLIYGFELGEIDVAPSLNAWGFAVLALLLMVIGTFFSLRQRVATKAG